MCIPAHSEVPVSFNKGLMSMIWPKAPLEFPSYFLKYHYKMNEFLKGFT